MPFEPHDKEFEQWLSEHAERHRLFADESVWDRINQRVNRRRWLPLVLSLLLITSGVVSWVMITNPSRPNGQLAADASSSEHPLQPTQKAGETTAKLSEARVIPFKRSTSAAPDRSEPLSFLNWTNKEPYYSEEKVLPSPGNAAEASRETALGTASTAWTESAASMLRQHTFSERIESSQRSLTSNATAISSDHNNTATSEPKAVNAASPAVAISIYPEQLQTIESVVNAYKGKHTRKSWKLAFSVSPTVSYRKLIEDKEALQAARSLMNTAPAMAVPEFESVVKHKPDLGLQVGLSVQRQLSDRISFTGGLQFNINKYDIRAYAGSREVATVGLSNGNSTGSVSSYTNYRSSGGTWANWLANFYFSASAPIGFQVRLAGNKKWQWGVGSTLQPTCILSNKTYVLSTDYKNYLEVPSLVRRWNLNGQAETFIGFQGKKTHFTLGPQARYQILSSFEKAYPVQEHLFDIGIKLGVGL